MKRAAGLIAVVAILCGAALVASIAVLPVVAAGALLHRSHTPLYRARPDSCSDAMWTSADVVLRGWRCRHGGPERRGTIVYLHGIGDNRSGAAGVVEVFSDLRSLTSERGRRMWLPPWVISRALAQAETRLGFDLDSASPVEAARHVTVPVLLLHGDRDAETASSHSQRVRAALDGPRTLILVPGVGHNQTLPAPGVWDQVARWIDASVTTPPGVR